MSNYENQSLAQLKKALKQAQSKKIKKPSPADADQTKQNIQEKINQLKLQSAELKWTLDKMNQTVQDHRQRQNEAKAEFENSRSQLDELKAQQKQATNKLKTKFSGRRIKNPEKQLRDTKSELASLKGSLITDSLSNSEEKAVIKEIKKQEEYLRVVQKYLDDGGDDLFKERDSKRGAVDKYMESHNSVFESFDEIRQEMNNLFASLDENREQQKEIKEKIGELQTQKSQVDEKYRNQMKAYRDHTRKLNDLRQAIAEKEMLETESRENQAHEANRQKSNDAKNKREAQKVEQAEQKKADAEKRQVDLAERRRLAEAEWERVQAEQKRLSARQSQEPEEVVETIQKENKPDPHREEKQMCRQLINMCQTMKKNFSPGKKKKKSLKKLNKMRLTHKPSVFSNFATAGVAVPTKYGDLDSCIEALQEKIESFSAENTDGGEDN